MGFMRGQNDGMLVGFVSGLMVDVFFGGGVLGVYALIYTVMGYLNGYFHRVFYPEDVKLPILFVFISDITYSMIIYIFMFLLRRRIDFFSYLSRIMLPETVFTVLVTIVIYRAILGINNHLEKDSRSDSAGVSAFGED
jgi:rod shape-determining protein MreD